MMDTERVKKVISKNKPKIKEKFKVDKIGIFGSYIKREQKKDSDLDILVEFSQPIGMFAFLELEEYLEKELNTEIDLVSKKALKPNIGKQILKEVEYL